MANYGRLKTMKAAAIGTILPWTGALTRIPKGWLICNGETIAAKDYPLLAQAIGDTYGGASFNIADFPNFPGQSITLPNINQKALMDCDTSYFGAGAIDANIDTTAAATAIGSYIGSNTDNGVPNRISDANTDILFNYTPQNFSGSITGSTFDPGFGIRTVYTGARKLGRRHTPIHSHPTSVPTISGLNSPRPGGGVSCSREVSYSLQKPGSDDFANESQIDYSVQLPPASGGFGAGSPGVVLGNIDGENPGPNYFPKNAASHGISNWIGSADAPDPPDPFVTPNNSPVHDRRFDPISGTGDSGGDAPYALGGGNIRVDNINFDDGSPNTGDGTNSDQHRPYEVFFNHSGIDFTKTVATPGYNDIIESHDHGSFEIRYDRTGSSLRMPGSITVNNVVANVVPDNLPDALNITVTVPTPKLIVVYIIRAY